jgi:hypothetical protein
VEVGLAHLALNHIAWLAAWADRLPTSMTLPGGTTLPAGTIVEFVRHPAAVWASWYPAWINSILARFPQG